MFKERRVRDPKHLKFIRGLACCNCGIYGPCEAAHIRIGSKSGIGLKPSDTDVISLCARCHHLQHTKGERTFHGDIEKVRGLARALYNFTGDQDVCSGLILKYRRGKNESASEQS